MFDRAEIVVRAGNGGNGVVSFRREKFVPFGGPDGGDGGDGGDVVIRVEASVTDLREFQSKRLYKAASGEAGRGKKRYGRNGEDLVLSVPAGTVVSSREQVGDDALIADLEQLGQQAVVAKGGKGGLGNPHFASSTNQAPQVAQRGDAGEENAIILELRLIADIGIIGYPNVGKSTLLAAASAAKPKIASYPFTTREPVLGVVDVGQRSFVLAEIPGLVEDAHLGRGLGHEFLRHVARTKLLLHLVDGSSASPLEDMRQVNDELRLYDSALAQKLQIMGVNKIDLPGVQARLAQLRDAFGRDGMVPFFISAATGEGISELMTEAMKVLAEVTVKAKAGEKLPRKVFRPQPRDIGARVCMEGDTFVVVAPELERMVSRTGVTSPGGVPQHLQRQLARLGIRKALEKAGIKSGDRVRCGNLEWEWQ
jgi:GTP-binding protein